MPRQRNRRGPSVAITPSTGQWHSFLTVGTNPDGSAQRLHRATAMCASCRVTPDTECSCYAKQEAKVLALEDKLAAGEAATKKDLWAGQYFTEWLAERVDEIEYGTVKSYGTVVRLYLVPRLVGVRLKQLDIKRIKQVLREVKADVSAQAARKTLRVLRVALGAAEVAGYVARNEARLVAMPSLDGAIKEVLPLSLTEARAIIPVILKRRNKARWLLGLVHGNRQGECLGLAWHRPDEPRIPSDVDLDAGEFTIREKLQRRTWQHGCADPQACGSQPRPRPGRPGVVLPPLHKTKPCKTDCTRHARACPPPCPKDCTRHASACPQRRGGGLVKGQPKSKAGGRTAAFEPLVLEAFREHRNQQDAERQRAGSKWVETGLVFTTEFGKAIDPKRDWDEFQSILAEAGLPPARVHALRHTTATFLLAAGVQKRVVMELMGWSQDMTAVYQHPASDMKRDAAAAMGAYLWAPVETAPDPVDPGSATGVLPADQSNVLPFRRKAG